MKILLLNQAFYPDHVSTAQHLTELAVDLSERGHQVTVISSRRAYDNPEKRFAKRENWRGIEIHRVSSTGFGKGAKWKRAADFASFIMTCCWELARLPRFDVVVALTSPPLISFIGAWFARIRGAKFVYWVMDLNPDEAIAAGWLREGSPAANMLDRLSRFSFRRAARIIALDRFMKERIVAKDISPEKVVVIPPWSHDSDVRFDAEGRERFRRAHGLQEKFVVMYSGNHSPCHPLDTLLKAAQQMSAEKRIVFSFVGGGSEFAKVKRFTTENKLENVLCLPYQPLNELSGSLSAADLHVVVMGNEFVGTIHPCKIYNVLGVTAPTLYIGPKLSHVTEIFDELKSDSHCFRSSHGDVDSLMKNIRDCVERGGRLNGEVSGSVVKRFAKGELLPKFVAELESLAKK